LQKRLNASSGTAQQLLHCSALGRGLDKEKRLNE